VRGDLIAGRLGMSGFGEVLPIRAGGGASVMGQFRTLAGATDVTFGH
jgi:hypothetical protein